MLTVKKNHDKLFIKESKRKLGKHLRRLISAFWITTLTYPSYF